MRPTKEIYSIAKKAAGAKGWDFIKFDEAKENYVVYQIASKAVFGTVSGIMQFVLVFKDKHVEFHDLYSLYKL